MSFWPRPEGLVPPRILDALAAVQAGDSNAAARLCLDTDSHEPLGAPTARLVRALIDVERGDRTRAQADLRLLSRHRDPAIAWLAIAARVEAALQARRFAALTPLLARIRARAPDAALRLWIDATVQSVELLRHGTLGRASLDALQARLERGHPAVVHAVVHVLRAERALLTGDLPEAVLAHRDARPYIRACGNAAIVRRHADLVRLLRVPFVDVEDWEEPLRTVSREELAEIEARDWQMWIDVLHRRVLKRTRAGAEAVSFARLPELWTALEAIVRAPRHNLTWMAACRVLRVATPAAATERARRLAAELRTVGLRLAMNDDGYGLRDARFVCVLPTAQLPAPALRLLGLLAAQPGARAHDLLDAASHRTVVRQLQRLRLDGYVRLVGGGAEARYTLV